MELYEIKPRSTSLLAVGSGRKWAEIETWESTRSGREGKGLATVIVGEQNEVPDHVGLNTAAKNYTAFRVTVLTCIDQLLAVHE